MFRTRGTQVGTHHERWSGLTERKASAVVFRNLAMPSRCVAAHDRRLVPHVCLPVGLGWSWDAAEPGSRLPESQPQLLINTSLARNPQRSASSSECPRCSMQTLRQEMVSPDQRSIAWLRGETYQSSAIGSIPQAFQDPARAVAAGAIVILSKQLWLASPTRANETMTSSSNSRELDTRSADYVVNALRAIVGPVPIVGPLFSELAGVVVPNQRMERIAKFAQELERRLRDLEAAEGITNRLGNDEFTDLLEEGIRQASRSLSDERRQYLVSLIVNGLSRENIEYAESRHLLRALDEMSDVEVVWLRYYREPTLGGDEAFREQHENVLAPAVHRSARLRMHGTRQHCRGATKITCVNSGCWNEGIESTRDPSCRSSIHEECRRLRDTPSPLSAVFS